MSQTHVHRHQPLFGALGSVLVVAAALAIGACRPGVPIVDTAPKPANPNGTISGKVSGPEGTTAIEGRTVEIINVDTGERQSVTTSSTGGYTFKCKPGKYRVEVTLKEGESFIKRPGIIDINKSDVDAQTDFIIGPGRTSPPQPSAGRHAALLGSPIA